MRLFGLCFCELCNELVFLVRLHAGGLILLDNEDVCQWCEDKPVHSALSDEPVDRDNTSCESRVEPVFDIEVLQRYYSKVWRVSSWNVYCSLISFYLFHSKGVY